MSLNMMPIYFLLLLTWISVSESQFPSRPLTVVTVPNKPFVSFISNSDRQSGYEQYQGFCVDLLESLSNIAGFKYHLKLADDRKYGTLLPNGSYSGMVGEIVDGRADLAMGDLTVTAGREEAIDFSIPFMNTGISLLYKRPTTSSSPILHVIVIWLSCLAVFILITAHLNRHVYGLYTATDPSRHQVNPPKFSTTGFLRFAWWFLVLVMVISFFAGVGLYFTIGSHLTFTPFNSAEELVQTDIQYGTKTGGSTEDFFKNSQEAVYLKMWEFMANHPEAMTKSIPELVDKVKSENGKYVGIMEAPSIEYLTSQDCDLVQVGGLIGSRSFAIGMRSGSPFRDHINRALLRLQEQGEVDRLKKKWWVDNNACPPLEDVNHPLQELRPLFPFLVIINLIALGLLVIAVLTEIVFKIYEAFLSKSYIPR